MADGAPLLEDIADSNYDPFEADEMNFGSSLDPYPQIAEWRKGPPVLEGSYRGLFGLPNSMMPDRKSFTVVGTKEVQEVLGNPRLFSNSAYETTLGQTFGASISTMNPPEHTRWRRIFQKTFLPENVLAWGETVVNDVVRLLIEPHLKNGHIDLIEDFTLRYPFEIIYRQLDLPKTDTRIFHKLAIAQTDYYHADLAREASAKLGVYFKQLIDQRRENPGDDLVSILAAAEVEGDYLPEDILVSFFRQLMNAAGDTTYRGTSILLTQLLKNTDLLEELRGNRSLIPNAIEEALRFDGPVASQARMATEDTVLGGVHIPKDSFVDVVAAAANRDPEVFENPDKFDLHRVRKQHYAFSRGPHICVGQHLARVEMTRALNVILDTMFNLRLDPDKPGPQTRGVMMRVPRHLYAVFDKVQ